MDILFKIEPLDNFITESEFLLESLYNRQSSNTIQQPLWDAIKEELKLILLNSSYDFEKVSEHFKSKKLNIMKLEHFLEALSKRRPELLNKAFLQTCTNFGETLVNFDWTIKMILGSSDLKTLQFPILQLMLMTINDEGRSKPMCFEISNTLLKKLVFALEHVS